MLLAHTLFLQINFWQAARAMDRVDIATLAWQPQGRPITPAEEQQLDRGQEALERYLNWQFIADMRVPARLGGIALARGNRAEALKYLLAALAIEPDHSATHSEIARLYRQNGEAKAAWPHAVAACELAPKNLAFKSSCRLLALTLGKLSKAESITRDLLRTTTANLKYYEEWQLARILAAQGQFDVAEIHLEKALSLRPNFAPARQDLERLRARRGK